eukprot:5641865-Amphidinium_carterae.1
MAKDGRLMVYVTMNPCLRLFGRIGYLASAQHIMAQIQTCATTVKSNISITNEDRQFGFVL